MPAYLFGSANLQMVKDRRASERENRDRNVFFFEREIGVERGELNQNQYSVEEMSYWSSLSSSPYYPIYFTLVLLILSSNSLILVL
jgi:hypothetical protein